MLIVNHGENAFKLLIGHHQAFYYFSTRQFHFSMFEMLIKRDPFIQAARDEIYRAFRTNNKKWTTHLRPVDPKDIDYDIDD